MLVDILLLTAMQIEYDALDSQLSEVTPKEKITSWSNLNVRSYKLFDIGDEGSSVCVALAPPLGVGQLEAALSTKDILADVSPSLVILTGIAGCTLTRQEAKLGDVAIARVIHDYEMGKEQNGKVQPRWKRYDIKVPTIGHLMHNLDKNWAASIKNERPYAENETSNVHVGDLLSGNLVMADPDKTEERSLAAANKVVGVEMEAAGVAAAIRTKHEAIDFLTIKAFSDYAGKDKADGAEKKDFAHAYACKSSALFTVHAIQNRFTSNYFANIRTIGPENELKHKLNSATNCYLDSIPGIPAFAKKIADAATLELAKEIQSLSSLSKSFHSPFANLESYEAQFSQGNRYLARAAAPFHSATKMWATSVDSVSKFWEDPHATEFLYQYLTGQRHRSGEFFSHRLFVFSRPEDAHARARLLDWHSDLAAGTYVTSLENYQEILANVLGRTSNIYRSSDARDFALLEIDNENGHSHRYVAELTSDHFRIQQIDRLTSSIPGESKEYFKLFSALENDLRNTQEGEISNLGIIRWKREIWRDKKSWCDLLSNIYADRTADAFHFAGLKPLNSQAHEKIRGVLARLKYGEIKPSRSIMSYYEEMGIQVVRLAKRIEYGRDLPLDNLSRQQLTYAEDTLPDCMVIMKFKDRTYLRKFMEDKWHSVLRFEMILELATEDTEIKHLLETRNIGTIEQFSDVISSDAEFANLVFSKTGIWRVDLIDDEIIDHMVEADPDRFIFEEQA